jgi:hypothetical protein
MKRLELFHGKAKYQVKMKIQNGGKAVSNSFPPGLGCFILREVLLKNPSIYAPQMVEVLSDSGDQHPDFSLIDVK